MRTRDRELTAYGFLMLGLAALALAASMVLWELARADRLGDGTTPPAASTTVPRAIP